MKIMTRDQFMEMPEGTLYASGNKWFFNDLLVKGTNCGERDWGERSLLHIVPEDEDSLMELGMSTHLNDAYMRHGLFDDEYVFYVFEEADLDELEKIIAKARAVITMRE